MGAGGEHELDHVLSGTGYRAIRALGAGGMGEVFEAEHLALGRRVVVKLLHRRLFTRADLADRMRLEGEALGSVSHPNVVAALDCGVTVDQRPYLVLERLAGRTLREELDARGKLPAAEAIDLAAQALDGLEAVHRAGMIHRDIKPENVFVCDALLGLGRVVKLLDLGVAKLVEAGGWPIPLAVPTEHGIALGTPRFFSPEQATGAPVDGRSDVYAMGVVLYAMLTGRTPFERHTTVASLLHAHASELPIPPSRLLRDPIPPDLDTAILRSLAKRPSDRFPSAAAFALELRALASRASVDRASPAPSPSPPPAPPVAMGSARLFFSVLAASLLLSLVVTTLALLVLR